MADYHPLIARAVAGLDKNTGENRRALYERARTALVAQLRGVQPALEESEITRERLALEEAIRKVEAESARRAREEARPPPLLPRRPEPRREERAARPSREPAPRTPVRNESDAPARSTSRDRPPAELPSLAEEAMRGYRDIVPESSSPAPEVQPPEYPSVAPPPPPPPPEPQPPAREFSQYEARPQAENLWALPLETAPPVNLDEQRLSPQRPRRPRQPAPLSEVVEPMPIRSYRGQIRIGLALLAIALLGAIAWWQSDLVSSGASNIMALVRSNPISTTTPRDTATPARPKNTDRIGQPSPTPAGAPMEAQRVVLYEQDPDDLKGKDYVGTIVWRTEMMPAVPGRAPELAVRADIEIPDRKMTVTWSLRRNTDPLLPASHTIEIMFNLPAESASGVVQNVPGVMMKHAEATRGVRLEGLAVKVTPGFFLIGLSAVESDMQINLQLLKERSWFDIAFVYANNRKAILAMQKGTPGERAFNDAFMAWKQ